MALKFLNDGFFDGKVGIGTATPEYKLHVNSDDASDDVTFIHHNSAAQTSGNVLRILSDAGDNTGSGLLNIGNGTGRAMYVRGDRRVGIGTNSPDAGLAVKGLLSLALSGTITISNSSNAVTGTNTAFLTELKIKDAIKIGAEIFTVSAIGSNTSLTLDSNVSVASTNVTAFIDPRLLSVRNGDSRAEAVIDKSGNFSVGDISNDPEQTTNGIPKFQVKTATAVLGEFPLAARFTTAVDAGDNSGVSVLINSGNDRGLMISAGRQNGNTAKASLNIVGSDGVEIETLTLLQKNSGGTTANVGIGTDSPATKLQVTKGSSGFTGSYNVRTSAVFENSGSSGSAISIMSKNTGYSGIFFGDENLETAGQIQYAHTDNSFRLLNNGGTLRMLINSDGDVGIGTTNPLTLLNLEGVKNTSIITLESTTNDANWSVGDKIGAINFYSADDSGAGEGVKASMSYENSNGATGATNALVFNTAGTTTGTNNTERMRIDSVGNVGIGTASPTLGKLQVDGISSTIAINSSTNTDSTLFMVRNSGDNGVGVLKVQDGGHLSFDTGATGAAQSEKMRIEAGGNVGIGTTNPERKLDVRGDIQIHGGTTATSVQELRFKSFANTAFLKASYTDPNANTETYLAFHTNTSGTANNTDDEQMRIAGNKVGIGTSIPKAKLDVKETTSDVAGEIIVGGLIDTDTDDVAFGKLNFANTNVANTQTNDILASIAGEKPDSSNRGELVFSTSNDAAPTERMRIDNVGNVGINTGNLTVGGDVILSTDSDILKLGTNPFRVFTNGTLGFSLTASQNAIFNGNVGIGTTNPLTLLNLEGVKNTSIITLESTTNDANWSVGDKIGAINFYSADDSGAGEGVKASMSYENSNGATGATNALVFNTAGTTTGTNNTERMRIDSDGKVGIGTTSPVELLYVENPSGDARIGINAPAGSDTEIKFSNADVVQYTIGHDDSTDNLVIGGENVDDPFISIDKSGNVGIGETTPTAPLQVVGIAEYTNNTTALAAGLTAGAFYRTGDDLKVVH